MMKFLTKQNAPEKAPQKRPRETDAEEDEAHSPRKLSTSGSTSTSNAAPASAASPITKADALSPLVPDVTTLIEGLAEGAWRDALMPEFRKGYFAELASKVATERRNKTVYPPPASVFSSFNLTPLRDVRVVILGQDPYHGAHQAHGLAFSVCRGVAVPPSLKNIYTELEQDVPGFKRPAHGNLEAWARRGVLLLNATLTVRAHEANSHEKWGWQTFTDAVVRTLNQRSEPLVFILWGGFAQRKGKMINRSKHHVIEAAHPSPLSVTKFRGCKCFSKANQALAKRGMDEVDWSLDP